MAIDDLRRLHIVYYIEYSICILSGLQVAIWFNEFVQSVQAWKDGDESMWGTECLQR